MKTINHVAAEIIADYFYNAMKVLVPEENNHWLNSPVTNSVSLVPPLSFVEQPRKVTPSIS